MREKASLGKIEISIELYGGLSVDWGRGMKNGHNHMLVSFFGEVTAQSCPKAWPGHCTWTALH